MHLKKTGRLEKSDVPEFYLYVNYNAVQGIV